VELKKTLKKSNNENISQERKVSNLLKEIQKLEQRFKFLELYKLIF
jgi:SAM-dependent MidA family methyltransferase